MGPEDGAKGGGSTEGGEDMSRLPAGVPVSPKQVSAKR